MIKVVAGWLQGQGIRQVPTKNFNARPQREISLVVLHGISLPPGQFGGPYIDQLFTMSLDPKVHPYFEGIYDKELSTHVFINREGVITQYVSFLDRAWHAGRSSYEGHKECNDFGIGIELEGTDEIAYTDAQYEALNEVIDALVAAYPDIGTHLASHSEIAPGRKTDPGAFFEYSRLHVQREGISSV